MSDQIFLYVQDASGVPEEVALFTGIMQDKGWQPLPGIALCYVRPYADFTPETLRAQAVADVEAAAYRADWGRTVAAIVVAAEPPQVVPIDQWRTPSPEPPAT